MGFCRHSVCLQRKKFFWRHDRFTIGFDSNFFARDPKHDPLILPISWLVSLLQHGFLLPQQRRAGAHEQGHRKKADARLSPNVRQHRRAMFQHMLQRLHQQGFVVERGSMRDELYREVSQARREGGNAFRGAECRGNECRAKSKLVIIPYTVLRNFCLYPCLQSSFLPSFRCLCTLDPSRSLPETTSPFQ